MVRFDFELFCFDKTEGVKSNSLKLLELKHPATGQTSLYGVNNDEWFEVQRGTEKQSSWFVDQRVLSSGDLYLLTPVDPLYLLIPLLEENKDKLVALKNIIRQDPSYKPFFTLVLQRKELLSRICEVEGKEGVIVFM